MSTDTPSASKHALEFKSSSLSLPVLLLASTDLAAIGEQLADKVSQAPEFFRHSPLVIDLQKINPQPISLTDLVKLLRQHDFLPVGIRAYMQQCPNISSLIKRSMQTLPCAIVPPQPTPNLHMVSIPIRIAHADRPAVAHVTPPANSAVP
jgi:septum formation inhibitor MinC